MPTQFLVSLESVTIPILRALSYWILSLKLKDWWRI